MTVKRKRQSKKHPKGYNKPLLEFIEEIKKRRQEKKEIETLLNRVIIIKCEDVMNEIESKDKG